MLKKYPLVEKEMTISQYSCLGNPMDREAWWTIVLGVAKELDMTQQLNNNNNNIPYLQVNARWIENFNVKSKGIISRLNQKITEWA